jgi:hypothetical protein
VANNTPLQYEMNEMNGVTSLLFNIDKF